MRFYYYGLSLFLLMSNSCDSGKLTNLADLPMRISESSALEIIPDVPLLWTIEDRGNGPVLYGLDTSASLEKVLTITNAKNHDWEDLTSDKQGNLYIGDFGNNHHNREKFSIYKINHPENASSEIEAERIQFQLPEKHKSEDFEAFFIWDEHFYIFSKSHKKGILIKVPNKKGMHTAEIVAKFDLDAKHKRITSADISEDGQQVVLLNHDKLFLLTDFKDDNFFEGKIKIIDFEHDSQKEGIVFSDSETVLISDEKTSSVGGNIYSLKL